MTRTSLFLFRAYALCWLVVGACILVRCSHQFAGGTSTTDNPKIVGIIIGDDKLPAPKTRVVLLSENFNPLRDTAEIIADTTDDSGRYELPVPHKGIYNIQATSLIKRTRLLICGINIYDQPDTVAADTLLQPGSVKIALPPGANFENSYVYIPGTTVFAYLKNNSDFVVIDSVAQETTADIAYSKINTESMTVLRYGVSIKSNKITSVLNPGWDHCRAFSLNTSASGASVTGPVFNFPVLIRLTAANFDFTQAKNNGEDLRFTKSDTVFLPYEIERWDPIAKLAEIWVKVDTVYGNDSTQAVTMYWGNIYAISQSNSASVFDTANGFQAVWHLGDNGDTVHDATTNFFNGMNYGSTTTKGMIGNAMNFANGNYIKIPGLLNSPTNVSLSAWVRSDTSNRGQDGHLGQEIVSIGDATALRLDDSYGIGTCGWFHNSSVDDTSFARTGSSQYLSNTGWHFIAFSINTTTNVQTLYIDSMQVAVSNDVNPISYSGLGTDTYIGIHGNGNILYNFTGQIDEVRVNNKSLSANWIKLCFMNQKEQDALVKW